MRDNEYPPPPLSIIVLRDRPRPAMSQHDRMTDAIAKYVIDDLRHLNFIESPHFIQLLVGISSNGIDMPSRDCLKKRLAVMKEEAVVMIRRALQDKQPALTCDLWTSDDDVSLA